MRTHETTIKIAEIIETSAGKRKTKSGRRHHPRTTNQSTASRQKDMALVHPPHEVDGAQI